MSKRNEFIKRKNLKENLKKYNAFSVYGYYPLFNDIQTAETVSPLTSYHIHEFEGVEYYMPEGLKMGVTQFHGDYQQQSDEQEVPQTTQQIEQEELPLTQRVEPEEPPPTLERTYTPPPPTTASRTGGSGGY